MVLNPVEKFLDHLTKSSHRNREEALKGEILILAITISTAQFIKFIKEFPNKDSDSKKDTAKQA
ncbi:BEM_HP_G0099660.mRNA.1.CDS.1 [Saccharomyces cerevisiae]|nr:BEM_HP_G0099660.mRNA.1.CDS.1 [Saccharomyces cerevisiae]CAI7007000.1 BEM_HP_G0099660.mRNA.1.CDS.1 [Saccharomyces cerevisiae]